jgi:predicted GH43/DUF377 family glycosyl hydrolase
MPKMKLKLVLKLFLMAISVVSLGSASSISAEGSNTGGLFTVYGNGPVLHHGERGTWNETYTDPGAVLYYGGQFHMFYNGFNGWPASVQIGYATSPDGINWTKQGTDPVLTTKQVSYAKVAALASSVLVTPNGTWTMYFYTWDSYANKSGGAIGRATAPRPTGPWTPDAEPVLQPGAKGTWDELRVDAPGVVHNEQGYFMYYGGTSASTGSMIGLATSQDGVHWTKHKDSADTDPQFAESSPVLRPGPSGTWDAALVHQPRVVQTPNGWTMVYRSVKPGSYRTIRLGAATSTDGIQWTKVKDNPFMPADENFGKRGYWYTALAYNNGTYYLYIEAQPAVRQETEVFLALHKGQLV